ncbi:MAG: hypothetical protein LBR93_09700 [Treponema sp.]|jgi:hypothetical protein|nr:hypothetical protein [Treponema sp.]
MKKLNLLVMLVSLLALSLALIGCPTDSDDDGGGGGGNVPTELIGNWLRDSGGTERYLVFNANGWGTDNDSFADVEFYWVITSATENKIEYQHRLGADVGTGSFEWTVSESILTISNSDDLSAGTYTKQQ